MENLNLYLSNNYVKEKEQQSSISELINKVLPMYNRFFSDLGWGYSLNEQPEGVSASTVSMIAFSMTVLVSGKPDIGINTESKDIKSYVKKKKSNNYENFEGILSKSIEILLNEMFKNNNIIYSSGTYGYNDPFTLMWTKFIFDNNKEIIKKLGQEEKVDKFNYSCNNLISDKFKQLYENKSEFVFTDKIGNNHIFPLLKLVQIYTSLLTTNQSKDVIELKYINEVKNTLQNCLYQHLSLVSIENGNFDTAELVFSLEGLLLMNYNVDNFDKGLLERVFQVVSERQEVSLYWRPLKPFVSNPQGFALLPISVEIAMSLIRICRLLGKKGEKLFSKNYRMFERYTEWVKTRVSMVSCNENDNSCVNCFSKTNCNKSQKFYGWCSEHIYQPDLIHPWETSQVLVYLVNFSDMLQKHIAYQSFKLANLTKKYLGSEIDAWSKWEKGEPVKQSGFSAYEEIGKNYFRKDDANNYSMVLYGPPGTGKSSIAEEIAKTKGWPLVTITPSDFIVGGVEQVETKAKSIFKVLEEQEDIVVLFDEIDRLVLDRDTKSYHDQSDIFQFMTPSMLVKLKDLRIREKIIFIIATNYDERIDKAIKRKGRIDERYLILPLDKNNREKLFTKINTSVNEDIIKIIIKKTALYTYTELNELCYKLKDICIDTISDVSSIIKKPSISLLSYLSKVLLVCDENQQKPIKEFLALLFLKAEVCESDEDLMMVFDNSEITFVVDFLHSLVDKTLIEEKTNQKGSDIIRNRKYIIDKLSPEFINEEMATTILNIIDLHCKKERNPSD